MNAVQIINARRKNGVWVFDDEKTGLVEEPFVGDVNKEIDEMCLKAGFSFNEEIPLLFSHQFIPGARKYKLIRVEGLGQYYEAENPETDEERTLWLCPAMRLYFPEPPVEFYAKVENKR